MHYFIEPKILEFKKPAGTSRGVYLERRLWYIHLYEGNFHGIGECAPLHDLSCDYCPDMYDLIDAACRSFVESGTIDYNALRPYPSILFALETAVLSLNGSKKGNALKLFDNRFTRLEMGIPINGLVWMGSFEEMAARIEEKLSQGFRCIKIKIAAIDLDKELQLITNLRNRFSAEKLQIRVDANGGFSPQQAPDILNTLSKLQIHSIEQPIAAHQWQQMATLCKNTGIPIALDEELIGINEDAEKRNLLDTIRPQYIILKPTLHGGLHGCKEWINEAQKRNIGYWITSALESNVGLNAIAQWAAQIDSVHMPQGLGTGMLFKTNYESTDLEISGEKLWFQSRGQRQFQDEVNRFVKEWEAPSREITVFTSGSTGNPKPMEVDKQRMIASAQTTIKFLGIKPGDTALLCMPLKYIAGKMMVVRSIVGKLKLISVCPSSRPFRTLTLSPSFAAITPMQAVYSLQHDHDKHIMQGIKNIIIGGGIIPSTLEKELRLFDNNIWSTYGMTETLSHVAIRKISGNDATLHYTPLEDVSVSLTPNGQLKIYAPRVNPDTLVTNDTATIFPDNTFIINGRIDNVVCSGGIKLQLEKIEQCLQGALNFPFVLTSVADDSLGEALAMLYEGNREKEYIKELCKSILPKYEVPRYYIAVNKIPLTETNKPARTKAKAMATELLQKQ